MASIFLFQGYCRSDETLMNGSIALKENMFIYLYTDHSSYCEGDTINVVTYLQNNGNYKASGNLTTRIIDNSNLLIKNETWQDTINGGEMKQFATNYTVKSSDQAGMYRVDSNFTYNKDFRYAELDFRVKKRIGTLVASPLKIEMTMRPGDISNETIFLWLLYPCYGIDALVSKSVGIPGDWVNLSANSIFLPASGLVQDFMLSIDVPRNAMAGDHSGYVYFNAEDQQRAIQVIVHVNTSAIFDLGVSIPSVKKEVCQGDDVYATVTITKIFPPGTADINMTYELTDQTNAYYDKKTETIAIDNSTQRTPTLHVPSNLSPGYYTFTAILDYNEVEISSTDIFLVNNCLGPPPPPPPPPSPGGVIPPPPAEMKNLTLNVSAKRLITISGNETGFTATVTNLGTYNEMVEILVYGIPSSWVAVSPTKALIRPNTSQNFIVLIKIPKNTEEGLYNLVVSAIDSTKSNEEFITLIIGKDWKSAAGMLLDQLEKIRIPSKQTLQLNCLEIGDIKIINDNAEQAREMGLEEYAKGNYEKSIDLFDYAISLYEKAINQADALIQTKSKEIDIFSFPLLQDEINYNLKILINYTENKDYGNFCIAFVRLQQLSSYSKMWFTAILLIIGLIIAAIVYIVLREYRKRKRRQTKEKLERIRKRLREELDIE